MSPFPHHHLLWGEIICVLAEADQTGLPLRVVNKLLLLTGEGVQWIWHDGFGYVGRAWTLLEALANPVLAPVFRAINVVVNVIASILFAPIGMMPGWLSNTIISAVTGVLLLIVFKYTSNQKAIGRVKDDIKANMLALKLFKDELSVTFQSQKRVLRGAFRLLRYALFPLLVMLVPVSLELAQMGLWYQQRPLHVGEETLVTVQLAGDPLAKMPEVRITSLPGADVTVGPFRIPSERQVCWEIRAREPVRGQIVFKIGDQEFTKQIVIGEGPARVSAVRPPAWWPTMILHPLEKPFPVDGPVASVTIDYPPRDSWTSGTDWWIGYFFVASLVFALIFKPLIKVRI